MSLHTLISKCQVPYLGIISNYRNISFNILNIPLPQLNQSLAYNAEENRKIKSTFSLIFKNNNNN